MIWIIGTGLIGCEYGKVLTELGQEYVAVGRGEESANKFEQETGHVTLRGGIETFLQTQPALPDSAIIAVKTDTLSHVCRQLLYYGVKNILLEKPGFGMPDEAGNLAEEARKAGANVVLAYNRRFYSSVLKAEEIIREDGGVTSFNFEFTEWTHTFNPADYPAVTMRYWLLSNSSHVIDTAFFLGGEPTEINCYTAGENTLGWHPSASIFAGAGRTENGALFNYSAGWQSPGRWSVEILTRKHRLHLRPMESLQIQELGSVALAPVEIDNFFDTKFKPGFYLQTKAFVEGDLSRFCTIEQQAQYVKEYYNKIGNY